MKISDLFLDYIIKTELFEMAYNRKEIINKTNDLTYEIINHMIKIYYFFDKNDYNGHIRSINSWIDKIQRMTLDGKKRLKPEIYFECFIENTIGDGHLIETIYKILIRNGYKPSNQEMSFKEFYTFLSKGFKKVSEDVSKGKFISIEDYFNFKKEI